MTVAVIVVVDRTNVVVSGDNTLLRKVVVVRHAAWLTGTHTQGILGKAETDAGLDTVRQLVPVKLVECLAGHGHLIKFHEAHGPVLLVAKTKPLVPTLFRKQRLELLFRGVWRQVTYVQGVAGRVQVIWVGGGEAMAGIVLVAVVESMTPAYTVVHGLWVGVVAHASWSSICCISTTGPGPVIGQWWGCHVV